ncbi:MAG: biotin--[acetyl-CoA-carboxylase] ligase [Elusimicrobia bacterium]|nr:biotin--[acetyl-CoA-carboxylase] ligase [Elusimicrobiota bacterium]
MEFPKRKIGDIFFDIFRSNDFYFEEECDSTQKKIRDRIIRNKPALFMCSRQTAGYGRFARRFFSPPGGLWFSVYIPASRIPENLPFALSEGIGKSLSEKYAIALRTKKPNDIVAFNGRKLAGFLVTRFFQGVEMSGFIVGVGMNVNNKTEFEGFSAVSLKELVGKSVPLEEVFFICLKVIKENSAVSNPALP